MNSGTTTDDAPADHASRTNEPIGRATPYVATVADATAVVALLQQAWLGVLVGSGIAGVLAIIRLWQHRDRVLGWSGLGVVLVAAVGFGLAGVSATMLATETPAAPSNTSTPTTMSTVNTTPPATSSSSSWTSPVTSAATSAAGPTQTYVDKELVVPHPDDRVEIDFDKPVVSSASLATGADLEYTSYDGLGLPGQVQIGTGPAERPSDPDACVDSAQTRPVQDPTKAETIEVGMAFCVITDKGNVIWFTVTGRSQDKYSPGFTFRATMWSR